MFFYGCTKLYGTYQQLLHSAIVSILGDDWHEINIVNNNTDEITCRQTVEGLDQVYTARRVQGQAPVIFFDGCTKLYGTYQQLLHSAIVSILGDDWYEINIVNNNTVEIICRQTVEGLDQVYIARRVQGQAPVIFSMAVLSCTAPTGCCCIRQLYLFSAMIGIRSISCITTQSK